MAVKDIRSDLKVSLALEANITTDTTTAGAIFDTAQYELGLMFAVAATGYTAGTYTLLIEESDDSGLSGSNVVSGDQLIGSLPAVSAITVDGADYATVGVISNKRFVRASIVSTSSGAGAFINVTAIQKAENMPFVE